MKTQLTKIKINGHGYKKGRTWNLAHLLPKRRLALLPDAAPSAPQPNPVATNPLLEEKPQPSQTSNLAHNAPAADSLSRRDRAGARPEGPRGNETSELVGPPKSGTDCANLKCGSPLERAVNLNSSSRSRVGKVARLPEHIRWEVNNLLRHNRPYSAIVQALENLGYPGFSPQNISNWKFGGFVDWFYEEQLREERLCALKALDHCTRSVDINRLQQNVITLAADKFMMIMHGLSSQRAIDAVYDKPELLPKYISAMHSLARCTTELGRSLELSQRGEQSLRQDLFPEDSPEVARLLAQNVTDDELDEAESELPREGELPAQPISFTEKLPQHESSQSATLHPKAKESEIGCGPRDPHFPPGLRAEPNLEALQPDQGISNLIKPSQTELPPSSNKPSDVAPSP